MSAAVLPLDQRAEILALAAQIRAEAVRDNTYQLTPVGREVAAYLEHRRAEGVEPHTVANWETVFSRLCLDHAHLTLTDFDGKAGTRLIVKFLNNRWGDAEAGTWNAYLKSLRGFFKWAYHEDLLQRDPTATIRTRRVGEHDHSLFTADEVRVLIDAQPRLRDRCGVLCLFDLALRRSELGAIQFKYMALGDNEITILGKGKTVRRRPFRWEETRLALERHILERDPHPDEFLLYPEKYGRRGAYPSYTTERIWEDRRSPLSKSAIRQWWLRCEKAAGVAHRRQHEARHTAGTDVLRATGNLELTRIYMRHASIGTTAGYMHLMEHEELAEAFKRIAREAENTSNG